MFLIKHPLHLICHAVFVTAVKASPTRLLFTFHSPPPASDCACRRERGTETAKVISTAFSSCFQGLKQHIAFQMLPGRPDVSERRSDVYTLAVLLRRPVALFVLEVCCASRPNHMQSCVFPGLLYVHSSHSHTYSHTRRYMSTNAWAALRAKKAIKPHYVTGPSCIYTPIKESIHTDTQRAEPRVKTKHVYVTRSLCYTAFMILDSILSYSMLLNCKRLFSFSTSSVFRHIV